MNFKSMQERKSVRTVKPFPHLYQLDYMNSNERISIKLDCEISKILKSFGRYFLELINNHE